jgi:phytoene synthase
LSIEIFGYKNPATRDYAVYLGKALQLTNILRDVKTDAARGRIYLPQSELKKFSVSEAEILNFKRPENFPALAASVAARAKDFYRSRAKNPAAGRPQRSWSPPNSWVRSIGGCCKNWSAKNLMSSARNR